MKVEVEFTFKAENQSDPNRIYVLHFPADLISNDGCLETKNMQIKATGLESMTINCSLK